MSGPQCSVVSLTDTELTALVRCARRRLVIIAPGVSEAVAKAIVETWHELSPHAVQVVLDPDPEVCRMGFGEMAALQLLHATAEQLGSRIHQQPGLRIGVVVTDETTVIYSPTPLLVEAGGRPGEKPNAIRLEAPILNAENADASLRELSLDPNPISGADVRKTAEDLTANPPMKFDLARKVRVFNARIEFVEFELHRVFISRMTVKIPSDLIQLLRDPEVRERFRGSFQLIENDSQISTDPINKAKQGIVEKYLINLKGHGTVIRREAKESFLAHIKQLESELQKYKKAVESHLQTAIDKNRDMLVSELLPGVVANPPDRWRRLLGAYPRADEIERLLRAELKKKFGSAKDICGDMKVTAIFKGVTYESLSDPEFIKVATEAIPSLENLHDEFDAAKAQEQAK